MRAMQGRRRIRKYIAAPGSWIIDSQVVAVSTQALGALIFHENRNDFQGPES
jgi:hypothetical protein